MKTTSFVAISAAALMILASSCKKDAKIDISLPDKFEGVTIELLDFADSTVIASAVVVDGKAAFANPPANEMPRLAQMMINGRARAYYIIEPGEAILADTMSVASGTPLNEKFAAIMTQLDSVENLDDIDLYTDFVEKRYNENRDNVIGTYLGVEWLKYANPLKVDSLLAKAPASLKDSRRAAHYIKFANLRKATAPGMKYVDFPGEDAEGKAINLSQYVGDGNYTLVDFWASWCPYCIKELPAMKELYSRLQDKGFEIVGVAVRDKADDTLKAVERFEIPWKVVYNTEKRPYDIYGFSGIPHHILIGPDGTIISRGESVAQIENRLNTLLQK